MKLFLILLLLLTGCSIIPGMQKEPTAKDKIDYTDKIISCIVFYDHIECLADDGEIYYAMRWKLDAVTRWDKSAWKVQ